MILLLRYPSFSSLISLILCTWYLLITTNSVALPDQRRAEQSPISDVNEALVDFSRTIENISKGKLQKTVFMGRNRILFVAGLNGAGHESWRAVFVECIKLRLCAAEKIITENMMHIEEETGTVHGLFGFQKLASHVEYLSKVYQRMKEIAKSKPMDDSPLVHVIGLDLVPHSALMSYPNFDVKEKSLTRPDFFTLAALAEAAGVDFRVVLLQHDARAIVTNLPGEFIGENPSL